MLRNLVLAIVCTLWGQAALAEIMTLGVTPTAPATFSTATGNLP